MSLSLKDGLEEISRGRITGREARYEGTGRIL
jgi:hypothetical protein